MKKLLFLAALLTSTLFAKADVNSIPSSLPLASYIVKEVGSGEVLMSKNTNKRIAPASLTKILTSIIAIESGRLGEYVTITREATSVEPTKAGFRVGDEVLLLDLVRAALVNSSNDAATAIGIYIGGSTAAFAEMMNQKAAKIGMTNSHFTNACGFDKGPHYSTAGDLLKLSEYAIKNKIFNEIVKQDEVTITAKNSGKVFRLSTHNKLLDKYKYSIGIKTGFTNKAGSCLIARAQKDNKDVIVIMLKSKTNKWILAEDMFEKAFAMTQPEIEIVEDEKVAQEEPRVVHAKSRHSKHRKSASKSRHRHIDKTASQTSKAKKVIRREAKAKVNDDRS
jgi:D-alanyl-D-alanine carboxypeptidase (penicillin-binding protein 5/6)